MRKILVSGCLNGPRIRFNETNVPVDSVIWQRWEAEGRLLPACPELMAGFAVPRAPAEMVGATAVEILDGRGRVREDNGSDVTDPFLEGATNAAALAIEHGCGMAVMTDGSPSCGSTYVFDGSFTGGTIPGRGVTAELLERSGIRVFAESQLAEADAYLRELEARDDE